jgi:hypothetical protein
MRSTAETLRASEQIHEVGILRRPGLHRAPGEIVEALELLAVARFERQLPALMPVFAVPGLGRCFLRFVVGDPSA